MVKDSLGDRMKGNYENVTRTLLTRRTPVIIRLDGRAFHTFTKGLNKPFDNTLMLVMAKTAKKLCENIQGCEMAYTQSDEISLLLTDYEKLETDAWFGYNIQKMVSIVSSMATLYFNTYWREAVESSEWMFPTMKYTNYHLTIKQKVDKAMFDARVFNIPKEEVANYFVWRQNDATRNSIQMLGQSQFSHKELHGKSCSDIQDMLKTERNINWNDLTTGEKRGTAVIKECCPLDSPLAPRTRWFIDDDIPIFTKDFNYIRRLVYKEGLPNGA